MPQGLTEILVLNVSLHATLRFHINANEAVALSCCTCMMSLWNSEARFQSANSNEPITAVKYEKFDYCASILKKENPRICSFEQWHHWG